MAFHYSSCVRVVVLGNLCVGGGGVGVGCFRGTAHSLCDSCTVSMLYGSEVLSALVWINFELSFMVQIVDQQIISLSPRLRSADRRSREQIRRPSIGQAHDDTFKRNPTRSSDMQTP